MNRYCYDTLRHRVPVLRHLRTANAVRVRAFGRGFQLRRGRVDELRSYVIGQFTDDAAADLRGRIDLLVARKELGNEEPVDPEASVASA
jgi:hypothetical protein